MSRPKFFNQPIRSPVKSSVSCVKLWVVNALGPRTKDWCTASLSSAKIGISWRGGSTKYRKAVAIITHFIFTAWPLGLRDFQWSHSWSSAVFVRIKLSTSVFLAFFMQS